MKSFLKLTAILMLAFAVVLTTGCSKSDDFNSNTGNGTGNNNGGGNSGGGNNGGGNTQNEFPHDFTYYHGFSSDGVYAYSYHVDGEYGYERPLGLGFGSDITGLYSLGVEEIAIGIVCLDGNIWFRPGWTNDVYVTQKGNTVWYTGILTDNSAPSWFTDVIFEHQGTTTTRLKWTYRVKFDGEYYFEGEHWQTLSFPSELVDSKE